MYRRFAARAGLHGIEDKRLPNSVVRSCAPAPVHSLVTFDIQPTTKAYHDSISISWPTTALST